MALTLVSNSFKEGETLKMDHILSADYGFGCGGGNKSPHLAWSGAPEGTKSFAVTCFDPDAPTGCGFWHWVVVNIPAGDGAQARRRQPQGRVAAEGRAADPHRFRRPGYGGPCPPEGHGPHRYSLHLVRRGAGGVAGQRRHLGRDRRLPAPLQYRRQGFLDGHVPALARAMEKTMQATTPSTTISSHLAVRPDWLDRRREPALEPDLPIVDPHHHLIDRPESGRYLLPDLLQTSAAATTSWRPCISNGSRCIAPTGRRRCARSARSSSPTASRR